MFRRPILLPVVLVLLLLSRVAECADETPVRALDLIPEDAAAAVAVDKVSDLRAKGERLFDETGMPRVAVTLAFQWLWGGAGVKRGIDENAAAAVVIAPEREADDDSRPVDGIIERLVLIVPVRDLDAMAANFELEADDMGQDQLVERHSRVLQLHGRHLYVGRHRQAVADCVNAERLAGTLSEAARKQYDDADILVLLGTEPWGHVWRELVDDMKKRVTLPGDPEGQQVARTLLRAVEGARYALAGVRVDDGIAVSLTVFLSDDPEVTEFLRTLRGGLEPSTLAGLPEGRPILAMAARGEGTQNVVIARSLMKLALATAGDVRSQFSDDERAELIAGFGRTWRQLNGSRLAVYRTDDPQQHGFMCLLAVFDPDDPQQFIDDARPLVRQVGQSLFRWSDEPDGPRLNVQFRRNAEQMGDRHVDVVQFDADAFEEELRAELAQMLGPQWHRLKICTVGSHVVVMLGSDASLLRGAVDNVRQGKRGLAEQEALRQADRRLHAGRKIESYFSIDEAYELGHLIEGQPPRRDATPCRHMTSTALTIHDDRVQLDVWVPTADIKTVARANGLTSDE